MKKGTLLNQWGELDVVVCTCEVEYPKPGMVLLVWRWLYDSLGGFELSILNEYGGRQKVEDDTDL